MSRRQKNVVGTKLYDDNPDAITLPETEIVGSPTGEVDLVDVARTPGIRDLLEGLAPGVPAIADVADARGDELFFSPEAAQRPIDDLRTLGFADEIEGIGSALGSLTTDEGMGDAYSRGRDERRERDDFLQERNPGSTLAGLAAGALATGGGHMAAARGIGLGRQLAAGAIESGVMGAGMSEADTLAGVGQDAVETAALDLGLGALLGGSGRQVRQFADGAEEAGRNVTRARLMATGGTPAQIRKIARRRGGEEGFLADLQGVGAFDAGPGGLAAGRDDILGAVSGAREQATTVLGEARQQLTGTRVSPQPVVQAIRDQIREAQQAGDVQKIRQWEGELQRIAGLTDESGTMSFESLDAVRRTWADRTNFDVPSRSLLQQGRRRIYGALAEAQQQAVDAVSPELGDAYREARHQYSLAMDMEPIAEQAAKSDLRGVALSGLETLGLGLGGAAMGVESLLPMAAGIMVRRRVLNAEQLPVVAAMASRAARTGTGRTVDALSPLVNAGQQGARLEIARDFGEVDAPTVEVGEVETGPEQSQPIEAAVRERYEEIVSQIPEEELLEMTQEEANEIIAAIRRQLEQP